MALSRLEHLARHLGLDATSETLMTALTHSSFVAEHGGESNERLEFLGDAVVDLSIADVIFTRHPELNEGAGSLVRSHVVNEAALADAARRLDLGAAMRVGRGVKKERGTEKPSLLADVFEAVVAALFLERGYVAARDFVVRELDGTLTQALRTPGAADPKTTLLRWAEARGVELSYEVSPRGPSHAKVFDVTLKAGSVTLASADGRSKKAAELAAARAALETEAVRNA